MALAGCVRPNSNTNPPASPTLTPSASATLSAVPLQSAKISSQTVATASPQASPASAEEVVVENKQYGFNFPLPASWKGYSIVTDKWKGVASANGQEQTGPLLSIRHPEWTKENPRQDIPILIFTLDQWDALQKDKFHIGAAPIGPSELGRNSRYVFALPARYNFAFPTGYEEVEAVLANKPLQPTENFGQ